MAALPGMLEHDRKRAGCPSDKPRGGVSFREYREIEPASGGSTGGMFHRICGLYGSPQTFVTVL